jgi:hypothetical protein
MACTGDSVRKGKVMSKLGWPFVQTDATWASCSLPEYMLRFLHNKASDRKLRLFGCGCCRQIWNLIPKGAARAAVEASEAYADKKIRRKELSAALEAAKQGKHTAPRFLATAVCRVPVSAQWVAAITKEARKNPK